MKEKPIYLGQDEWWYKGCFIHKQIHPKLLPFHIFQDTDDQKTVGTCITFAEAKAIAERHEVKKL